MARRPPFQRRLHFRPERPQNRCQLCRSAVAPCVYRFFSSRRISRYESLSWSWWGAPLRSRRQAPRRSRASRTGRGKFSSQLLRSTADFWPHFITRRAFRGPSSDYTAPSILVQNSIRITMGQSKRSEGSRDLPHDIVRRGRLRPKQRTVTFERRAAKPPWLAVANNVKPADLRLLFATFLFLLLLSACDFRFRPHAFCLLVLL